MKTEKKLDCWVWFIIKIFPLFYVLIFCIARSGSTTAFVFNDLVNAFTEVVHFMFFEPVASILIQIFSTITGGIPHDLIVAMCVYISYLVFVELLRFLCIFFTFLFKLFRNWIEGWV